MDRFRNDIEEALPVCRKDVHDGKFIKDPKEAVRVGEVVKVKVLSVDVPMRRISLSRKALLPPGGAETKRGDRKETQKPTGPRSLADQLTALKTRFEKKL